MTAYTVVAFRDKYSWEVYGLGDEYEADSDRIAELTALGILGTQSDAQEAIEDANVEDPQINLVAMPAWESMTVAQLRAECRKRGITVPRGATKDQLIALLRG